MKSLPKSNRRFESRVISGGGRQMALAVLICGLAGLLLQAGCASSGPTAKNSGLLYQQIDPGAHPAFLEVVKKAAGEAPMAVTFDADKAASSDYRLDLNFSIRNKGLHDTEAIWTITTMYLFTLYPSTCGHFELTLSGDLYNADGERLKSWNVIEQDTAFLWLFQGDDCGVEPSEESIQEAASKMLKELYAQMARDGAFSGKVLPPVDGQPLVYVNAVNAEQIVQQVLKTDSPFANYTTDASLASSAWRVVRIEYEFVQPHQSLGSVFGRGTASMMTLGLIGMCTPNKMVLNAEVLGPDNAVFAKYQFEEKKRGSINNDCAPPTDVTHPDVAAKLLRKLLKQMKKDKLA